MRPLMANRKCHALPGFGLTLNRDRVHLARPYLPA